MNTCETVASRLYALCYEHRITINRLSTLSVVPPSTVKNIICGKSRNPGIVTIKMLCDGFGITLRDFFSTESFDALEQEIK